MQLKYVGPKPLISHTGIDFDNNKEDKYVYLNIIVQLLKSINHKYIEDKVYTYHTQTTRLSNDDVFDELKKFCPNISSLISLKSEEVSKLIEHDLQRAHENSILNNEEKEILINNINIMKEYSMQRAINKAVYYCAVDQLSELVKEDHLDYIVVPMFQKFAHVLHSVQGSLQKQKFPIDTQMDIYQEDGKLLAKLKVINIV